MDIIKLETPMETEKHFGPITETEEPFYINEYGKTFIGTPCYQLRMSSTLSCVQYVISGSGVIICDNKIHTVREGDTFLLSEGKDQIYYSTPDNNFERIWINFKGELGKKLIEIYGLKDIVVFKNTNCREILEEIQNYCLETKDPVTYKNGTALLFHKLIQFLALNKNETPVLSNQIEAIRLFLDLNVMNNPSLSDVASHFSMSKEHLIRIFSKTYEITPHQYILQSRIRIAMIMLKTTDDSITEISDKLSFSDQHHFSEAFYKHVGIRPSAFRKNVPKLI